MNRLAEETSPYLRQHRDNPVDWYPWGEEAFARAKDEGKPILLSVGYAACHWCHVMAHESFEDEETAELMNRLFVNVKVDREERPDVDAIYMEAVQAMSGHGGWPMTVWLTPEGRPFYGGTYFPRHARGGMPSFTDVAQGVAQAWQERRAEIEGAAERLSGMVGQAAQLVTTGDESLPGIEALTSARDALVARFDARHGGFGAAPKFPQPDTLEALLRAYGHDRSPETLDAVTTTLDAMAAGGIYDHLGGGFARYSVDERWLVPHFEKMLYDEALLGRAYLHAWQVTGHGRFVQVLSETIAYALRDLRHPDGGFFSSEDADSEGEEGKFYVWTSEEIRSVLGDDAEAAEAAIAWWGVTPQGNFEGANILYRPHRGNLARREPVERARQALFEAREKRVRPGLDDKVLTEWNGLMVSMLAEAGAATGRQEWVDAARTTADFLLGALRRPDDFRWLRSWQDGQARHLAYAADYAAMVDALTRLAEATGEARWIAEARATADAMVDLFWDDKAGGLFTTGHDAEALITRPKDVFDHATPSANSVAAVALLRLGALTGDEAYGERAEAIVRLLSGPVSQHPTAFCHLLGTVDLLASSVTEIAITGDRPDLVALVQSLYLPNAVLAWGEPYPSPLFEAREPDLAYVCRHYACDAPVSDADALRAQLLPAAAVDDVGRGTAAPAG